MPTAQDPRPREEPRSPSRRALLGAGLGLAFGARLAGGAPRRLQGGPHPGDGTGSTVRPPAGISATKIRNLTGPVETGAFAAPWTDLGIPVLCPDGSLLFVCGDTFSGAGVGAADWRAPVALRSSSADLGSLLIDGSVGGAHAEGLVPETHAGGTTAIPSDVFAIGDTLYMHLMRGVIYQTHHSDFWRSTDNGETWEYLCQWPGGMHGGQFQQKTYAVADDGYCYVLSTVFNRTLASGLLLHRVPHAAVGNPGAYEPWGYAGSWAWGHAPTTIDTPRKWGEICLRAMGGKHAFTWLNMEPVEIRAQILPQLMSDWFQAEEQALILPAAPGSEGGKLVASPYGGFILPGSTFDAFHIAVSQWYDPQNYRVMQYRIDGLLA